jgi:DNA-nicking Smr family endonuclease
MPDDDDDDLFHEAMKDAVPLGRRSGRVRLGATPRRARTAKPPPALSLEHDGERVLGRGRGVTRQQLAPLCAGEVPVDVQVDLHGMTAAVAAAVLRGRLLAAVHDGKRCVLVIHGRGRRSQGYPVLRDAVIGCLGSRELAVHVRGLCSALPRDGGSGALYVWLRAG